MSGRRGLVSDEEAALFRYAVQDAKPLEKRPLASLPKGLRRKGLLPVAAHQVNRFVENGPAASSIGGHTGARLRRGRLEPEARIDLHGHSYDAAYHLLVRFLAKAYSERKKLVLVITGKGGVLRPHLPLWLNGRELQGLVIGIREAHARHGGGGAFYVALYQRKSPDMTE